MPAEVLETFEQSQIIKSLFKAQAKDSE